MKKVDRRRFLKLLPASSFALYFIPSPGRATECKVSHPLVPPAREFQGQCPVCGMVRPMWARTWITFETARDVYQVCSFHCLADWTIKSGAEPNGVMLAVYHEPNRSVPAKQAFVVMGSAAAGTMSPVSKIVFADKCEADEFAANCGGEVVDFTAALVAAKVSVAEENKRINARRLVKGKIVEPKENDNCPVCNMFPIRYPYGKCQIRTRDGRTLHFCSTQCLFAFIGNPSVYVDESVVPFLTWVVDRNTGMWISGFAAFYVVGSSKIFGPMGYEAFPFNSMAEARNFVAENGGNVAIFKDVGVEMIVPGWKYPEN